MNKWKFNYKLKVWGEYKKVKHGKQAFKKLSQIFNISESEARAIIEEFCNNIKFLTNKYKKDFVRNIIGCGKRTLKILERSAKGSVEVPIEELEELEGFKDDVDDPMPDTIHIDDPMGVYSGFDLTEEQAILLALIRIKRRLEGNRENSKKSCNF